MCLLFLYERINMLTLSIMLFTFIILTVLFVVGSVFILTISVKSLTEEFKTKRDIKSKKIVLDESLYRSDRVLGGDGRFY